MLLPEQIKVGIAGIVLLIASLTDLKTREVPDTLNFGLIGSGIGVNLLLSLIFSTSSFFIESLAGFVFFLGFAYLLYYTGQWGGGDSKLLIGLGSLFGLQYSLSSFMIFFIITLLVAGALYGILWSFFLGFKQRNKLTKEIRLLIKPRIIKIIGIFLLLFSIISFIFYFTLDRIISFPLLFLSLSFLFTFALWIGIKAVENGCMKKHVDPKQLTEGDWIAEDVIVDGTYICGPKDLGIEKKQISQLLQLKEEGKISRILIKEGIPFVPSFFLAFLLTIFFQDVLISMVKTFI